MQNLTPEQLAGMRRQSPASSTGVRVFRFGAERSAPVDLYAYRDVLDELSFAAQYRDAPALAILTGGFGVTDGRGFVEMNGFESFVHIDDEFDPFGEIGRACTDIQQQPGDDYPVGLFGSMPGTSGIIPDEFARLHLTYFNVPFQPLVIFDPAEDVVVVYCRMPRRAFFDAPLHVVTRDGSLQHERVSA